ncbi:MAG: Hsp20/alpha crystallin family protein [Bacteroidetes bacterium]|nr:Hsp20/alpha crystallin family protein [Bacteroidota bacterium]
MSLLVRNRATLPSLVSDFFNTRTVLPGVFDLDTDLIDFNGGSLVVPGVNIVENEKDYKVELAAPGLERKDFKVELDNNVLTISAEKEEEKKEEKKNYKRREFSYNSFSRSFTLPENSLTDKIDAKYENGVLRLTLPKKEVTVSKPAKEIKVT